VGRPRAEKPSSGPAKQNFFCRVDQKRGRRASTAAASRGKFHVDEAATIKEFLLVPFVGACIHVPPPPANQIVYVKAESGIGVNGSFEPVNVVGVLKAETAFTGLADAAYTLNAEKVEVIKN
jgi:hypothetical protein